MTGRALSAAGRSGTTVEFVDGVVEKTAPHGPVADRLVHQYQKQSTWPDLVEAFYTVPVQGAQLTNDGFTVVMPFCGGVGAAQWAGAARPEELRQLAVDLVRLVDAMVARCELQPLRDTALAGKTRGVLSTMEANGWARYDDAWALANTVADRLVQRAGYKVGREPVPIGLCHGDLTLANVLFAQDGQGRQRYWLFDHLNVHIESPLLDMAKLRQETRLQWASRTSTVPHDRLRYAMGMRWLDRQLVRQWRSRYTWWRTWAEVFEPLNLLRVLPYMEPGDPTTDAILTELESYAKE